MKQKHASPLAELALARALAGGGGGGGDVIRAGSGFVYRTGGIANGRVFTDWGLLVTAVAASDGEQSILIDGSLTGDTMPIPAGAWDFGGGNDRITLVGAFNSTNVFAQQTLTIPDGTTIAGVHTFRNLNLVYSGTGGGCVAAAAGYKVVTFENGCQFTGSTGPFLEATGTGAFLVTIKDGSFFYSGVFAKATGAAALMYVQMGGGLSLLGANTLAASGGGTCQPIQDSYGFYNTTQGAGVSALSSYGPFGLGHFDRDPDAAPGDVTSERTFYVNLSGEDALAQFATFTPATTVVGADMTAGTLTIRHRDQTGALIGTVATFVLNAASGGTFAYQVTDMNPSPLAYPTLIATTHQLTFELTKIGGGVAYGAMSIDVGLIPI